MKRNLLIIALLSSLITQAQEKPYNQWTLDFKIGVNKAMQDFAPGYWMPAMDFPQASLGVRHMFNSRFGTSLTFGYQKLGAEEGQSLPFETKFYRANLEGVANLGNMMSFGTWTRTFGLLAHAGAGYANMSFDAAAATKDHDHMLNWVVGITPQVKLSNRFAFTADFSMVGNLLRNATYDGTISSEHVQGQYAAPLLNLSAGITVSLGSKEETADFYPHNEMYRTVLDSLEERLALLEKNQLDSDQDGVPDYLDHEPNTSSGVAVDSKGVAVDKNEDGIPDKLEKPLDERYASMEAARTQDVVKELLNGGYVNVYFGFNSDQPATYSLDAINKLAVFMRKHPEAEAELTGFSDPTGNPEYNQQLSERRAQSVHQILVAAGISPGRLSFSGMGEDDSLDTQSSQTRQLVRRVSIRLKE